MNDATPAVPIGVYVVPPGRPNAVRSTAHGHYIEEILRHAGMPYVRVDPDQLAAGQAQISLLITVGDEPANTSLRNFLQTWLPEGGAWLAVGGTAGLPELLGAELEPPPPGWGSPRVCTLGDGYLQTTAATHPVVEHLQRPLHFFNGTQVRAAGARVLAEVWDAHRRAATAPGLLEYAPGRGRTLLLAPDAVGTVVRIQQGVAVTRDGVPAPDGSAPVTDGVLKSDDGLVLDWIFDRGPLTGTTQAFTESIADHWRELLLRAIFYLCRQQHIALPLLWLYPRNLPALAHLSHDSDGNDPALAARGRSPIRPISPALAGSRKPFSDGGQGFHHGLLAERMLELTAERQVQATWCVMLPGYPPDTLARIHSAGHELAMHYDAMTEPLPWSHEEFARQKQALTQLFGGLAPVTNKNHYLRWEGDCELWDWCAAEGIELDESKGPSKTGAVGFLFGTCHPYLPVTPNGKVLNVLELPTLTQDLEVMAPAVLGEILLAAAEKCHGIMHLLFHPAHIAKPAVAAVLRDMLRLAQERGLEWWTARRINTWERARRQVYWQAYRAAGPEIAVELHTAETLTEASVLWLVPAESEIHVDGSTRPTRTVQRWGWTWQSVSMDLPAGTTTRLTVRPKPW